jgi:hypothetical protein
MKICPVGDELFHANGGTDITKLTVAFRNFTNSPKKATIQNLYHRLLATPITMCNSSAKVYNPWHSSTSSNTGEHSVHTAVAFSWLQLQTAVVDSLSRDSWHKEVIKCLLLLILLPCLSQHFLMLHCSTTRAAWSRRYSETLTVYYKRRPFVCLFCPPKYVGHLKATVQNKTVRNNEPTRTHYVKLYYKKHQFSTATFKTRLWEKF